MKAYPALQRGLLVAAVTAVFAGVLLWHKAPSPANVGEDNKPTPDGWHMFGGTLQRNFVNTTDKGLPDEWDVENGTNVRWTADVGSKGYGGPIVAGGRVFVGTNNDSPRDPAVKGDKGVLMCFDE